jgi:hypothetical protein
MSSLAHVIIPTETGVLKGIEQPLINAKVLHLKLGVGRTFGHWILERIEQFAFVENTHFVRHGFAWLLCPKAALDLCLAQRAYRGVDSPAKKELQLKYLALRERFLLANPVYEKVLRYLTIASLTDGERAALMGWTIDQWGNAIRELHDLRLIETGEENA